VGSEAAWDGHQKSPDLGVGSVRLKLFKVAAQVRVSGRRVYVQISSAYPFAELFGGCHRRLTALPVPSG